MKVQIVMAFASVGLLLFASAASAQGGGVATSSPVLEKATFAGGCFWCMEPAFDKLEGVKSVVSGYTGGRKENPTYEEVSSGSTGHAESIEITYDPAVVSYSRLLDVFWRNIDPTVKDRQFCDVYSSTARRSSITARSRSVLPRRRKERSSSPGDFPARSTPRLPPRRRFTPPRRITRNTTRRIRSDTNTTGTAAAATSASKSFGAGIERVGRAALRQG